MNKKWVKIPIQNLLVENSTYNRTHLKKRLIKENLLKNICNICNQIPVWNNEKLSLQLDHINGVKNDNRLENLRILCPNCHSQTGTFAGKRLKKHRIKISQINPRWRNRERPEKRKVIRPTKEKLKELVWQKPTSALAKEYNVSDVAISKWCKTYGIEKPPRGYWTNKPVVIKNIS